MKHTKGPWHYDARNDQGFRVYAKNRADAICDIDDWHDEKTTEANVILLACAPELLRRCIALEQVCAAYRTGGRPSEMCLNILRETKHVVAEAKGDQPMDGHEE